LPQKPTRNSFELSYPVGTASGGDGEWSAEDASGSSGLHEGRDYYWSYNSNVLTAESRTPGRRRGCSDLPGYVPDLG